MRGEGDLGGVGGGGVGGGEEEEERRSGVDGWMDGWVNERRI